MMIFFTDHYNAISIERLPSKTKIGKWSGYLSNSLLYKPDFPSAKKDLLSLLTPHPLSPSHLPPHTQTPHPTKKATPQQVDGGNILNLVLKGMLKHFEKILQLKKISEFPEQKRDQENFTKRINQKLNQ